MQSMEGIMSRLNLSGRRLSKGHRRIAAYLEANYDKAVYMTAAKLGELTEVSESTVVRFALALGYEGYPQMQKALKEIVRHRLTSTQRFAITGDQQADELVEESLKKDLRNIRSTMDHLDTEVFAKVVQSISKAKSIYILGLRSAAPLAQYLDYYLRFMFDDVRLISNVVSDTFETIARSKPGDVLIAVSFPRYSNRTLESMRFAKTLGVQVIGITDGSLSPLHECSDLCLDAVTDMASFADSLAAPMSLLCALLGALGQHNQAALRSRTAQLEEVWDAYRVYAQNG